MNLPDATSRPRVPSESLYFENGNQQNADNEPTLQEENEEDENTPVDQILFEGIKKVVRETKEFRQTNPRKCPINWKDSPNSVVSNLSQQRKRQITGETENGEPENNKVSKKPRLSSICGSPARASVVDDDISRAFNSTITLTGMLL